MTEPQNSAESEIPKKKARKGKGSELEAKCEEYLAGWKRALADYDNLKRDLAKERDEGRRRLIASMSEGFLKILEHFDQAIKYEPNLEACDESVQKQLRAWISGVTHIRTAMTEELKTFGMEPIEPEQGSPFDAVTQESVGSRVDETSPPGVILEVVARGWKLGDKLVSPPRVIISE